MEGKLGKVRASALLCIQSLARVTPRRLQGYWTQLLPVQHALQPSSHPHTATVVSALLYDPLPKVEFEMRECIERRTPHRVLTTAITENKINLLCGLALRGALRPLGRAPSITSPYGQG